MKYEIIENAPYPTVIKRNNEDGSTTFIPMNESNADYQAYLRWVENPDAELGGTL